MQTEKLEQKFINKRIGNTTYLVSVHFSNKSSESMGDKILRLAKYEAENMNTSIAQ